MRPDDIAAYLDRIGLPARPPLTLDGLTRLQRAHLLAVPFENLDITLGHGITLDDDHLIEKIVRRRRGGYCFELNRAFGLLLDALGVDCRPVLARVLFRGSEEVTPLTHTLNLVTLGDRPFLVDVGFGGTNARMPVPLEDGWRGRDVDGRSALRRDRDLGWVLSKETLEGAAEQFATDLARAWPADLELGNHFTATHPKSVFTHGPVASLFTPEGRVSLKGRTLRTRDASGVTERPLCSAAEFGLALSETFGIELDGADHGQLYDAGDSE